jgi:hypothetical protein
MTIQVQVANNDKIREVEVVEVAINRVSGERRDTDVVKLRPGESRTFYVYMLRDLLVREVDPAPK